MKQKLLTPICGSILDLLSIYLFLVSLSPFTFTTPSKPYSPDRLCIYILWKLFIPFQLLHVGYLTFTKIKMKLTLYDKIIVLYVLIRSTYMIELKIRETNMVN